LTYNVCVLLGTMIICILGMQIVGVEYLIYEDIRPWSLKDIPEEELVITDFLFGTVIVPKVRGGNCEDEIFQRSFRSMIIAN
jgi:hypothetical protein